MVDARVALDARNAVGESPVWDERRGRLAWIDIVGRRVHALDPATGAREDWPLTGRPNSLTLADDGGALLCLEKHVCRWDWGGDPVPLVEVEPGRPTRLNEAAAGPDGRLWMGTMRQNIGPNDEPLEPGEPAGALYSFGIDGILRREAPDAFGIPNTLAWPAPDVLVAGDTLADALYAYPVTPEGLGPRRTFQAGLGRGLPDGSCLDAEGCLWTARHGGGCLARSAPDGSVDRVVDLPAAAPTSCAFGGEGLRTLFVTTARWGLAAPGPHDGALLALEPGPRGRPARRFGA